MLNVFFLSREQLLEKFLMIKSKRVGEEHKQKLVILTNLCADGELTFHTLLISFYPAAILL